jgi:hypothetical protein
MSNTDTDTAAEPMKWDPASETPSEVETEPVNVDRDLKTGRFVTHKERGWQGVIVGRQSAEGLHPDATPGYRVAWLHTDPDAEHYSADDLDLTADD